MRGRAGLRFEEVEVESHANINNFYSRAVYGREEFHQVDKTDSTTF